MYRDGRGGGVEGAKGVVKSRWFKSSLPMRKVLDFVQGGTTKNMNTGSWGGADPADGASRRILYGNRDGAR